MSVRTVSRKSVLRVFTRENGRRRQPPLGTIATVLSEELLTKIKSTLTRSSARRAFEPPGV